MAFKLIKLTKGPEDENARDYRILFVSIMFFLGALYNGFQLVKFGMHFRYIMTILLFGMIAVVAFKHFLKNPKDN